MYLRAGWTVNVGFLVLDWLIKIFNLYVNAARPPIIRIPAPRENNKLKFNAAIISIYGTLQAGVTLQGRHRGRCWESHEDVLGGMCKVLPRADLVYAGHVPHCGILLNLAMSQEEQLWVESWSCCQSNVPRHSSCQVHMPYMKCYRVCLGLSTCWFVGYLPGQGASLYLAGIP